MSTTHKLADWLQAAADQTKRAANTMLQKYGADAAAPLMKENGLIVALQAQLRGTASTPIEEFIEKKKAGK